MEKLRPLIHDKILGSKEKIAELSKASEHNKGLEEITKYIDNQTQ